MSRKKTVMPPKVFERVLKEYSEIGGGRMSLTPVVGDIFLDRYLVDRIKIIRRHNLIRGVSFTTNAVVSDRFSDQDLSLIVNGLSRIYISIYGIDPEEYRTMTKTDAYNRLVGNLKRLIEMIDDKTRIRFGFRCLKKRDDGEIRSWIWENFDSDIGFDNARTFSNWGNAIDTSVKLPFDGEWTETKENTVQCLIPLVAYQIYSDGNVSFCPCCDFDGNKELHLGNIEENTLEEILGGDRSKELWDSEDKMPSFCGRCSFHMPLTNSTLLDTLFENPLSIIGG